MTNYQTQSHSYTKAKQQVKAHRRERYIANTPTIFRGYVFAALIAINVIIPAVQPILMPLTAIQFLGYLAFKR